MSLVAEGKDGNGLQLENFRLNFKLFPSDFKNRDRGLFILYELRSYFPLDVL